MISNADRDREREKERYKDIFHIVFFFFFSMMVRGLLRGLLRLALDSLRPVSVPFVVVVVVDVAVVRTAAAAALSGHLARINVHEHALFGRAWNFDDLARRQKGFQLADVGRVNFFGELDRELDDETAFVVGRSVGRHSLVHNLPDVAVLHHFAGYVRDDESSVVEGGDGPLEAAQGLDEIQLHFNDEIAAVTRECRMGLLVQNDDDVARFQTGFLVTLAGERNFLSILHSLVDMNLEDFSLVHDLPTAAVLTSVFGADGLSLSLTGGALALNLLHHTGAQLLNSDLHSGTAAVGTLLRRHAFLAATAFAIGTNDFLLQREFANGARVQVFQGNTELVDDIFALPRSSASSPAARHVSAEEHVENVHGGGESAAASVQSLFDRLLAALIVNRPLLLVG